MVAFIDTDKDRYSVEFMWRTLDRERVGGFLTSRGYRVARYRAPSVRDNALIVKITGIHDADDGVYGVRMMWHALRPDLVSRDFHPDTPNHLWVDDMT